MEKGKGKPRGKPFPKGVSGNPGGRPKIDPEVREILKAHSVEAASRLVEMMYDDNPKIAMWAITDILDRTQGKAVQAQDISMDITGYLDIRSQVREVLLKNRKPKQPSIPDETTSPANIYDGYRAEGTD